MDWSECRLTHGVSGQALRNQSAFSRMLTTKYDKLASCRMYQLLPPTVVDDDTVLVRVHTLRRTDTLLCANFYVHYDCRARAYRIARVETHNAASLD